MKRRAINTREKIEKDLWRKTRSNRMAKANQQLDLQTIQRFSNNRVRKQHRDCNYWNG